VETRLDSWKEIATYLRRGERTVKRWETERGLPIHRVPGGGRGSVYTYTAELAEWLKSIPVPEEEAESEEIPAASVSGSVPPHPVATAGAARLSLGRKWVLALAGLVLVGIAGSAVQLAVLHHPNLGIFTRVSSLFAKNQPKSSPTASRAVSDAEQRLAHDFYLKGRYEWNQRTPDSLNRALDDFTQAIVHDPNRAESYVGLADTYNLLQIYSMLPLTDSYPRAIAAARRAVQLDDSMAEAHRALAFSEFYGAGDYAESEKEFLRAIELNPKDPVARRWYANAFAAFPGRYEESLKQFDQAQELDPASHSTLSDKGMILFDSGKREEGIALLKNVERTNPEFFSPHFYLMVISLELHDFPTVLNEGQKAAEVRNDPVLKDVMASAREGYARSGQSGLLKNLYTKQREYYLMGKYSPGMLAKTCVAMGKRQEALQLFEVAYSRHEADALWFLAEPDLLTLKDEPRYKALVKKINFPDSTNGLPGSLPPTNKSPY
jgi:tetratricopeptide (TPR) repeat protein